MKSKMKIIWNKELFILFMVYISEEKQTIEKIKPTELLYATRMVTIQFNTINFFDVALSPEVN